MASCAYCGTTILFGGKRDGDLRFCNDRCLERGTTVRRASQLPPAVIEREVWRVHQSNCPKCAGRGPVDVHTSYRVWSALVVTQWSSRPNVCCQPCGTKARLADIGFCLVLGWWGFPWGLIWTPVQVFRNIAGVFSSRDLSKPSPELRNIVTLQLASQPAAPVARAV